MTLTNQGTSLSRSTTTTEAGEYSFPNLAPGTYRLKIVLQGYKAYAQESIPVGPRRSFPLDVTLEVGAVAETVTVTGQSPVIETSNASTGTVLDAEALQTLPSPGRAAFMIGNTVPTVVPSGDAQFNRQQDQTNASLVSLGGGTRRGNNYTLDGVPITDMRNRASANPSIEALEDVKVQVHTYDAEMGRTGGGVFNTTLKSGTNDYRGTASSRRGRSGGSGTTTSVKGRPGRQPDSPYYLGGGAVGGPIVRNRTFFWFATESYHDVQTRNVSDALSDRRDAPRRLLRRDEFGRPAGDDLRPGHRQPFPGNQIPANRMSPVAVAMLEYLPLPTSTRQRQHELHPDLAHQQQVRSCTRQARAQVHRQGVAERLLPVQPHRMSRAPTTSAPPTRPSRTASPIRTTTILRAAAADPGAEQHLGAQQQLGAGAAVRQDAISRQRHAHHRFRSGDARLLADVSEPDSIEQVSAGADPRLRPGHGARARRDQPDRDQLEVHQRERHAVESRRRAHVQVRRRLAQDGHRHLHPGDGAGFFDFDKDMTSSTAASAARRTATRSPRSCSAIRRTDGPATSLSVSTPLNVFTHYFGGYAQDDWRVNSKITLTYGLRLEHETGCAKRTTTSPSASIPHAERAVDGHDSRRSGCRNAGADRRPAADVCGRGRQQDDQGNPPAVKWSPRVGAVYSLNERDRAARRLRPLLGAVQLSDSQHLGEQLRPGRLQPEHDPHQQPQQSDRHFENPFPNGIEQPSGNSRRALTNLDSNISYVDQNRTAPRVQQFSVDLQRELPGNMALTVGYMGARSDHIGLGGSNDIGVNINQLDPKYLALGSAALDAQLPNPFLNNPNVPRSLSTPATLSRAPAAAVSAIRPDQRPAGHRRPQPLQRRRDRADQADVERVGRPLQLHLQRAQGQPGRREQLLRRGQSGASDEQLQLHRIDAGVRRGQQFTTACYDPLANTASACSTCRTASSSRRWSSCRSARASAGRTAGAPIC